jgi:hypothetical protein
LGGDGLNAGGIIADVVFDAFFGSLLSFGI